MKNKIKKIIKYSKFPFIMSVITLLIGTLLFSSVAIGIPMREKMIGFLVSYIPFFIFLLITLLSYYLTEKQKKGLKKITTIITAIFSFLLIYYYLIALFMCILIAFTTPITNPKYYTYYVTGERLKTVFPAKIPNNVENVEFYYVPGFLQGGTNYALYYIDKNMTMEEFDNIYKDKAIWIGRKEEYTENSGLLTGAFAFTPENHKDNENDFIIYLIEGSCDDSGYCNHGDFLIAAFNEKTNEVIFRSEQW